MDISKLFGPGEAASFIYGAGLGAQAPIKQPRSMQEAQSRGNIPNLLGRTSFDIGVGLVDDLAIPLAAAIGSRWIPWLKPTTPALMKVTGLLGFGISGGLAARDFHEYIAARSYLAHSQAAIPDARINPITGFVNQGQGAMQRTRMTGIASPAAGGILYRMDHNPFSNMINTAIGAQDPKAQDPRVNAIAYGFVGAAIGGMLGATAGLGKATALSLALGTAAGFYGIYQAHNPNLASNVQAAGAITLLHPGLLAGGLLYGASYLPWGVGRGIGRGLNAARHAFGDAGVGLKKWGISASKRLEANAVARSGWEESMINLQRKDGMDLTRRDFSGMWTRGRILGPLGPVAQQTKLQFTSGTYKKASEFMNDVVVGTAAKTLINTGKADTRWEMALGFGHLGSQIVMPPTMAYLGYQYVQGKHSHSLMDSNRGA